MVQKSADAFGRLVIVTAATERLLKALRGDLLWRIYGYLLRVRQVLPYGLIQGRKIGEEQFWMFFGRLVTITAATKRFLIALRGDLSVENLWVSSTSQTGSSLWFDSGEKN